MYFVERKLETNIGKITSSFQCPGTLCREPQTVGGAANFHRQSEELGFSFSLDQRDHPWEGYPLGLAGCQCVGYFGPWYEFSLSLYPALYIRLNNGQRSAYL